MSNRYPSLKMIGGVAYIEEGAHREAENRAYVLAGTKASSTDMAAGVISGFSDCHGSGSISKGS